MHITDVFILYGLNIRDPVCVLLVCYRLAFPVNESYWLLSAGKI